MLDAKIGGITPDILILNGRCVLCAWHHATALLTTRVIHRDATLRTLHVDTTKMIAATRAEPA